MNIVEVIPISRGIGKEVLSYFSAAEIPVGSLVKVPLRNRQIPALVVGNKPAGDLKAELKNSAFAMRKIGRSKTTPVFLPEFVTAAQKMAEYVAGSTGSVLASITSNVFLESASKVSTPEESEELKELENTTAPLPTEQPKAPTPKPFRIAKEVREPFVLQADEEDRLAHYKSLIREQFARKKSVFFCLPTIQDTKRIYETLPKGIEEYTFVLNSALSKKELINTWNKILEEKHQVLIIGTGSFLGIPRRDIGTIVIERESSSGFKNQSRPYVDIRTFAEYYTKELGATLILGDLLLRVETLWRVKNGEMTELAPLKFRSVSTAETSVLDMKKYKTLDTPEFRILSEELESLISRCKDHNESLFIFAARRGLSPMTVCGDCGTTVLCNRCSAPIILHKSRDGNFFLCHRCGERRSAEERCKNCSSWKLTTLGIGIELLEETLNNMFPDIKIFRMDKDTVKTHKQALKVAGQFYNNPGSILLGTEMALAYLEKPIENAAIAAIDSLFSIPDFRMNEKIMNIMLRTRAITQKYFLIQTRSRNQHIFDYASKGNLMDFYREEIDERKKLLYPPFSTLVKITLRGTRQGIVHHMRKIEELLADYHPLVFPAFIETVNNKSIMHALLKLEKDQWISAPLQEKLLMIQPEAAVNVDPESLL
jgi:primosomal protein N'